MENNLAQAYNFDVPKNRPGESATLKNTHSLSRLAAQLAHDLNLPLASISAYAEELIDLAKERYGIEAFNQLVNYIEIIQKEANHCREIVEKMLTYAKGMEIQLEVVDLHAFLNDCVKNIDPRLGDKKIAFTTHFDPKVTNITTDPTGLRQVIMNILANAYDAIEHTGEIILSTHAHDKMIAIEISDNGSGIEEQHLTKIFDPFFTTKCAQKGTGLGLAICNGILQTLKGKISVSSQKGEGTTISVLLPKKLKVILT